MEVFERITDAFFGLDRGWRFTYLNPQAERLLSRSRDDLVGKNVWDEFPEAKGSTFQREYERAAQTGEKVSFEAYYPPLEAWFEVNAYPSEGELSVFFRDVSDGGRAEERLRAILVQYGTDIITILEADGTIRYESPAIQEVLGYGPEDLVGTNVLDHIHPDDVGWMRGELNKVLQTPGSHGPVQVRFRHADGSWRHLEGIGNNLLSDPSVRGIVINSRDVTERERVAEALKESEARFRSAFEGASAGVALVGLDNRYLRVNRALCRMFGYEEEDLVGKTSWEVTHPEDLGKSEVRSERLLQDDAPDKMSLEKRYLRKDGSVLYTISDVSLVRDLAGEPRHFVGQYHDITERKEAEEALRKSETSLTEAQRLARMGSWEWDVTTGQSAWSNETYRLLGFAPQEFVPTLERFLKAVHPDDSGLLSNKIGAALREGEPFDLEHRLVLPNGEVRVVHCRGEVAFDEGGEPQRMVGTMHDVTERKKAEEALKESEERFRQLFEQAVDTLLIHDEVGRIIDCNVEACRSLGYSREEMLSLTVGDFATDLTTGEGRGAAGGPLWRHDAEAREFGAPIVGTHLAEHRRKDGTTFPVEVRVGFVDYGGKRLMLASCRDVTEVKRAAEALQESEERYRAVFERSMDGIYLFDGGTGRVIDSNLALHGMLGYAPGELRRMNIYDIIAHDPEEVNRNARLVLREGHRFIGDRKYRKKDGSALDVEVLASTIPHQGGEAVCAIVRDVTKRKRAEEALRRSEERFRAFFEHTALGISIADPDRRLLETNHAYQKMVGYSGEELLGKPIAELSCPDDVPEDRELTGELLDGRVSRYQREKRYIRKDGRFVWVRPTISVARDEEGRPEFLVGVVEDITERKQAEEELRHSERELAEAQRIAHVGSWSFDAGGDEARWSDEMYRIFGYAPREFVITYKKFLGLVHPEDKGLVRRASRLALYGDEDRYSLDYRLVRPDGGVRFLHTQYEVVREEGTGRAIRLVGTSQDVTERKALEERLEHQALHDPLTGLPNRVLLTDRLGHAIARLERRRGRVAVLFVDLDNFKYVNDSLGHHVGDRLLVAVTERLRSCLRPEDTAARLGGDEFAIVLENPEGANEATRVAERVVVELRTPFALGDQEVYVTPSIGVVLGGPGDAPEDLLRKADVAMYRAKEKGKARYEVFDPDMEAEVAQRLGLENDLRRALERDEFEVYYQPVVALDTGQIIGMEALVRWEHPERGPVSPSEFVPLAEEIGLIVPIGRQVLKEACRQVREWQELYSTKRPGPALIVGVNVSARQLSHPGFVEDVEDALHETGLEPRWLTLEITESAMVGNGDLHIDTLRRLEDLGVRFALDDFGTGYSSLSYLRSLPVGMLKIDRSFMERIGQDGTEEDEVLLSGVVSIAHGLGLRVLAEGVETPEQLARVRCLGCELVQGYHFSKPLTGEATSELLANGFEVR